MRGGPALGCVPGSRHIFACTRESVTRRTPWRADLRRGTTLRRYAAGPLMQGPGSDHRLSKVLRAAFDVRLDRGQHVAVHRLLSGVLALSVTVLVLASPAVAEAKPKGPPPTPTPTVRPTPTPSPPPTPVPTPAPGYVDGIDVSYHQGAIDWWQAVRVRSCDRGHAHGRHGIRGESFGGARRRSRHRVLPLRQSGYGRQ